MLKIRNSLGRITICDKSGSSIFGGVGFLSVDEAQLYAKIEGKRSPFVIDNGQRVIFNSYDGPTICTISSYGECIFWPYSSNTKKYHLRDYFICDSAKEAKKVVESGIYGVTLYLNGYHSKNSTIINIKDKSAQNFEQGENRQISKGEYQDGVVIEQYCTYSYLRSWDGVAELQNKLALFVTFRKPIPLDKFYDIIKAIKIYWSLFKNDTHFDVSRIDLITSSDSRKSVKVILDTTKTEKISSDNAKSLYVDSPTIDQDLLHAVIKLFMENDDTNGVKYGFSRYLQLISEPQDVESATMLAVSALDSICRSIASRKRKRTNKEKIIIKKDIEKIKKLIESNSEEIDKDVLAFYCGKDTDDIYSAMSRDSFLSSIGRVMDDFRIGRDESLNKALKMMNSARQQIVHGQKYEIPKMLPNLKNKDTMKKEKSEYGGIRFTFGYECGNIKLVQNLIGDMGRCYFTKEASHGNNPIQGKEIVELSCRSWYSGDPILEAYHDHEWCKENHDDRFQFEMLCLEGASVGLSWKTIMHKRESYRKAFHNFDIDACAAMTDDELEALLSNPGLIRNRNKIFSARKNAQIVKTIQKEFGSFDAYVWSFADGKRIDKKWHTLDEIPTVSDVSKRMSMDMKKRGIGFVGPVITYSFLQSIGIVNDHLVNCAYR